MMFSSSRRKLILFVGFLALTCSFYILFYREKAMTKQQKKIKWLQDVMSGMINSESTSSTYTQRKDRICGTKWQEDYNKLHREILESRRPRQFIVFTCKETAYGCAGYGNRLLAISSHLFLAILTQRAFLIQWDQVHQGRIEFYLNPKGIAWNYSTETLKTLPARIHFWGKAKEKPPLNGTDVLRPATNYEDFLAWLQKTDLLTYFDHPVEKFAGSWYFANDLLKNQFLKKYALELGISSKRSKYSLVGCAFDFLFKKSRELEARLDEARTSLGLGDLAPKLGLHIRMGDVSMGKGQQYFDVNYKVFFDYAQALSEVLAQHNSRVFSEEDIKWFLATDDKKVKQYAVKKYPKHLVTQMINPQHMKTFHKLRHSATEESMYGVMVDHFLLSECDVLILTKNSTFGKTASVLLFHSAATIVSVESEKKWVIKSPHKEDGGRVNRFQ